MFQRSYVHWKRSNFTWKSKLIRTKWILCLWTCVIRLILWIVYRITTVQDTDEVDWITNLNHSRMFTHHPTLAKSLIVETRLWLTPWDIQSYCGVLVFPCLSWEVKVIIPQRRGLFYSVCDSFRSCHVSQTTCVPWDMCKFTIDGASALRDCTWMARAQVAMEYL